MFQIEDLIGYIENFYGYGNLKGKVWFIGMEEAGSTDLKHIKSRLKAWQASGSKKTVDLVQFHDKMAEGLEGNFSKLFHEEKITIQPTWRRLIELLLTINGLPLSRLGDMQRQAWGRIPSNGEVVGEFDNCLLELMPLPSANTSSWNYQWLPNIDPRFATRYSYTKAFKQHRIEGIKKLIAEHGPEIVVFYGVAYGSEWKEIAEVDGKDLERWNITDKHPTKFVEKNGVSFVITYHPMSRGLPADYFVKIGEQLKNVIS